MTPRIGNIARGRPSGYSQSELEKFKGIVEDAPVFAYMRKSTNKKEQEESIEQQQEGIQHLTQELGIDLKRVRVYSETKSGFENRSREEWKRMIKDIDATNAPCILLCRDTSRLSRNPRDNLLIADRIFGDKIGNKRTKKTIGSIYFLGDNFQIQEWNERSDKKYIVDKLHQNYLESLETRTKSVNGHILKLQAGIYPYHPAPKGLEHIIVKGKKVLTQNGQMPFVYHAFEMKVERRGHKEISKYLKQYGGIKIGDKELTDRYFTNTVYIGKYTEKTTGQIFDKLLFAEGKPPIPLSLWDKVQRVLSKRGRIYRTEKDVFEERGKIEGSEGLLSCDPKKKQTKTGEHTYTYYKNTKAGVNIVQEKILKSFAEEIEHVILFWGLPYIYDFLLLKENACRQTIALKSNKPEDVKKIDILRLDAQKTLKRIEEEKSFLISEPSQYYEKYKDVGGSGISAFIKDVSKYNQDFHTMIGERNALYEKIKENLEKNNLTESSLYQIVSTHFGEKDLEKEEGEHKARRAKSDKSIKDKFSVSEYFNKGEELKKIRNQEISRLEGNKKNLEEERKEYRKKAVLAGMSMQEIDGVTRDIDNSIVLVQEQIEELSGNTDMEELLEQLPAILAEIVELSQKAFAEKEIEKKKKNIIKLFEISVSNFSINNKKELKIKLFEVLDGLVKGGKVCMEAPAGVEPASRALQAPVGPFYQGAKWCDYSFPELFRKFFNKTPSGVSQDFLFEVHLNFFGPFS